MTRFAMKDLGEAKFCLGLQIICKRKEGKMLLLQKSYLENLLEKFGMENSKPISTPQDLGMKLSKNDGKPIETKRYQAAIGGLTYAVCATRPELAAALSSLNQYSSNPSQEHWKTVKRVLSYIKGTLDYGLLYQSLQHGNLDFFQDAKRLLELHQAKAQYAFVDINCKIGAKLCDDTLFFPRSIAELKNKMDI